jgi:hypothetical protein
MLHDMHTRPLKDLRISVTDRCNSTAPTVCLLMSMSGLSLAGGELGVIAPSCSYNAWTKKGTRKCVHTRIIPFTGSRFQERESYGTLEA